MRLDKYLKVARLAKRRSEAKDATDAGRIESGGRPLRASHAVKPGDEFTIHYASRSVRIRVEAVPERAVPKHNAGSLYTILEDEPHLC